MSEAFRALRARLVALRSAPPVSPYVQSLGNACKPPQELPHVALDSLPSWGDRVWVRRLLARAQEGQRLTPTQLAMLRDGIASCLAASPGKPIDSPQTRMNPSGLLSGGVAYCNAYSAIGDRQAGDDVSDPVA